VITVAQMYELDRAIPRNGDYEWVAPRSVIDDLAREIDLAAGHAHLPVRPVCLLGRPLVIDDTVEGLGWREIEDEVIC